jgi:integrase/recombinase XerC
LVSLAAVRNIASPLALRPGQEVGDFEQELVDQFSLAMAAAGLSDGHVGNCRAAVIEFARWLSGPLWTATCDDADGFLADQRRKGRAVTTRAGKAGALASFFEFVISRYQGDIAALTGVVVAQPIDEFNRQSGASLGKVQVPPSEVEVEELFSGWRLWLPEARKFLPAARDYFAASLWRRVGLRINETVMLDIRDWRPDLGQFGKLHVRHGKGSRGRRPKARLVPAINGVDQLMDWWLAEVRHLFGDDWSDLDAPLLPSERHDHAITAKELTGLKLTDIVDGRLQLDGRDIPLAGPVRVRLATWLDCRAKTWPATANPHLFISRKTGPRLTPVVKQFPWHRTNLRPQALREDRILAEIHATGGDVRRICDLFGLTVSAAMRYATTLEPFTSSNRIDT